MFRYPSSASPVDVLAMAVKLKMEWPGSNQPVTSMLHSVSSQGRGCFFTDLLKSAKTH